jgi:hypothetical protein
MRGHYAYYGISGNFRRISWYAYQVVLQTRAEHHDANLSTGRKTHQKWLWHWLNLRCGFSRRRRGTKVAPVLKDEASRAYNADMTDKLTPPAPRLSSTGLVLPPNCREVTGVPMAFIGATSMMKAAANASTPAPSPAPSPAPPEGAKPPTARD